MAVRHGYGKIAGTDALVFAYDTGDTRNSYKGEPTTNLISSDGLDMTTLGSYTLLTRSQVADSSSPSGYACEMEIQDGATINPAARIQFGNAASIPTSGNVFISVYAKFQGGPTSNIVPRVYTGYNWYDMAPLDGGSIYLTSEYRRFGVYVQVGTGSGGPNPGFSMTHNNSNRQTGQKSRWHSPQVELKSHTTPFVNGTRSATQGLLDLIGNSSIDLSNVSFNSSAEKVFDGTNDYIGVASSVLNNLTGPMSCEAVFLIDSNPGDWVRIFGKGNNESRTYGLWYNYSSNLFLYQRYSSGGGMNAQLSSAGIQLNKYYHMVGTSTANTHTLYINGVAVATATNSNTFYSNSDTMNIGFSNVHTYHHGTAPVAKLYNRALTASEVKNNYNNYKTRFNI